MRITPVEILDTDTLPELDSTQTSPPEETETWIKIDREARTVAVYQREARVEYTQAEFDAREYGWVIDTHLGCRPDSDTLAEYLESPQGQISLAAICDDETKSGRHYDPDSDEPLASLLSAVERLEACEACLWDAAEWYYMSGCPVEIRADTTDAELLALARQLAAEAEGEGALIGDSVWDYLKNEREKRQIEQREHLFESLPDSTWESRPDDEEAANAWARHVADTACRRAGIDPTKMDEFVTLVAEIEFH